MSPTWVWPMQYIEEHSVSNIYMYERMYVCVQKDVII